MEELRRLEGQLSSMHFKDVDLDLLQKLLGSDGRQEFEGLVRMESLLEEGGYIINHGDHFELTPRGVRKVGQLALRDIYRQLKRDGLGAPDRPYEPPENPALKIDNDTLEVEEAVKLVKAFLLSEKVTAQKEEVVGVA